MDIEILSKVDNNVIGREEYCFLLSFTGSTPNRQNIREEVKTKIGSDPSLFVIRRIEPLSGRKSIKVHVYVYKDKETMKRVEPLYVLKRNNLVEEKKEEQQSQDKK